MVWFGGGGADRRDRQGDPHDVATGVIPPSLRVVGLAGAERHAAGTQLPQGPAAARASWTRRAPGV